VRVPIAYRLQPVYETEPGGIANAAVMSCTATGRVLSGMGGGGRFLAPEVVKALEDGRRGRVICDADLFDRLTSLARKVAEGQATAHEAAALVTDLDAEVS